MVERFAHRIKDIDISGIRKAFETASGDFFNLGLGEPDFDTPAHVKEAAIRALNAGFTSYTSNKGIEELRAAICDKFKRDNDFSVSPEEIIVTSGASEALHIALLAVVERGDEVLIPNPGFVSFAPLTKLAEAKPVGVPLSESEGFTMPSEAVKEKITPKTKALIINSPANPTGAVESEENIKALVDIAHDHRITIISDEVYEHLIYDGLKHISPARFSDAGVITVNAVSKTYAMTGFRLGYLAAREEYVEQMLKIHQYIQACASSISQHAALAAISGPQEGVAEMRSEFKRRRDFAVDALHDMEMTFNTPKGAFYIFPRVGDEQEFVDTLKQRGVIVTPGSAFGTMGTNHVRISYAASFDDLKRAFAIMKEVVNF
uniref:Aromatic-amino-acid aminotransferase 2 n=1 Tax=Candidatus Methanophagaceae archaeon ANME-1 ERB6 TaxID=2759912 RepID=A0A7G9YRT8_9EURY|nr:aromatic-amino-acid aminotransferase 2 [Methanosarcinales archaeon ANME-1 ERB6]